MALRNAPGDALPVLSLVNSPDNAPSAASICEAAFALIVGPISGETSIVLAASSSSKGATKLEKKIQM